jgi:hypothetical protein
MRVVLRCKDDEVVAFCTVSIINRPHNFPD